MKPIPEMSKECFCPDSKPGRIKRHLIGCPALKLCNHDGMPQKGNPRLRYCIVCKKYYYPDEANSMKQISEMSKDEINRELCERLGLLWHHITTAFDAPDGWEWSTCTCGDRWFDHAIDRMHRNPDFYSDPVSLLAEMMKQKDWKYFLELELDGTYAGPNLNQQDIPLCWVVDKKGVLALQSLDWMRMPRRINGNS